MLYLTDSEAQNLRMAELNATCGYGPLFASDPWAQSVEEKWQIHCGNVARYNEKYGWASGCTAGKRIGSKIRSYMGTYYALASELNQF